MEQRERFAGTTKTVAPAQKAGCKEFILRAYHHVMQIKTFTSHTVKALMPKEKRAACAACHPLQNVIQYNLISHNTCIILNKYTTIKPN